MALTSQRRYFEKTDDGYIYRPTVFSAGFSLTQAQKERLGETFSRQERKFLIEGLVLVALIGGEIAGLGAELVSGVRFALRDWMALLALPLLFALLATLAARLAVERVLERIL